MILGVQELRHNCYWLSHIYLVVMCMEVCIVHCMYVCVNGSLNVQ